MLVLSRQRDETIMIGDDIEITVVDIRGDKVRLGITAPSTVPVHRKEVYEAIQRENREAAKVKMEDFGSLPKGPVAPEKPGLPGRPRAARPMIPIARPHTPETPGGPAAPGQQEPKNQPPETPPAGSADEKKN